MPAERGQTNQWCGVALVLHVLFIGNSLTYTNDLPGTVAALALSVARHRRGRDAVTSVTPVRLLQQVAHETVVKYRGR